MSDVIREEDLHRLLRHATLLVNENSYSPIEIIKEIRCKQNCSISEAKEAFLLASRDETLGQYQERVIEPLLEEIKEELKD